VHPAFLLSPLFFRFGGKSSIASRILLVACRLLSNLAFFYKSPSRLRVGSVPPHPFSRPLVLIFLVLSCQSRVWKTMSLCFLSAGACDPFVRFGPTHLFLSLGSARVLRCSAPSPNLPCGSSKRVSFQGYCPRSDFFETCIFSPLPPPPAFFPSDSSCPHFFFCLNWFLFSADSDPPDVPRNLRDGDCCAPMVTLRVFSFR